MKKQAPPAEGWKLLLGGLLLAGWAGLLFHRMLFFMPKGIHEWAQADRLALAIRFYDRGFNFFQPATFNLASAEGITGVEFPLQAYLAALGGLVLGRNQISFCFRLLDTLLVLAGMLFLFRFVYRHTRHFGLALLPGLFLLSSPVFVFYTCNYLPDAVGTALLGMAVFYFFQFFSDRHYGSVIWCMAWLTLATLIKLSTGIYFVSMTALLLYEFYRKPEQYSRQQLWYTAITALAGLLLVLGYTLYNRYFNIRYGAHLFLAHAMPVDSWETFAYIRFRIASIWRYEYFHSGQYYFLLGSFGVGLWGFARRRPLTWPFLPLILLSAAGCAAFFWLMGRQFIDHDYYFLTSGLPLLVLLVLWALLQLPALIRNSWVLNGLVLICGVVFMGKGYQRHQERITDPYKSFSNYYEYRWMEGGAQALARAGIPREARLLVLNTQAPNLALVYFDRLGLTRKADQVPDIANLMRQENLDYLLMAQTEYSQVRDKLQNFKTVVADPHFVLMAPVQQP